jgi:V8-like Glu-specific endopeptidase
MKKKQRKAVEILKTKNTAKKAANEQPNQPMIADEFLLLNNQNAERELPKEIADAAQNRRIRIYTSQSEFPAIVKSRENPGVFEFELSPGTNIGLPGRAMKRVSGEQVRKALDPKVDARGHRHAWVDFTPHAKTTIVPTAYIRRPNGKIIEPYYGVFGAEDRQVYYPGGYPWICIGKVFTWSDFSKPNPQFTGSGVLVGGRVVLTAGHMVPWGSNNWAMRFVPAFYDGASILGPGVSSWVSDAQGYNDPVSAWDMAVLRLYTPLGNSYGYFGAKTYSSSWEGGNYWTLAGYPGAIANANRPSRQMWFPMLDDDGSGDADEIEYEADSSPGDSGGPVFGFWNGEAWPSVVGTVSGGTKEYVLWWVSEDTNVGAGGSAIVNLIIWARSNWPV